MKHTRLTALILAFVTVFTAAALTSCRRRTPSSPDNPFGQGTEPIAQVSDTLPTPGSNAASEDNQNGPLWQQNPNTWKPSENTGEKRLYGKPELQSSILRTGDMFITENNHMLNYFTLDIPYDEASAGHLCFDPLCNKHYFNETCNAYMNFYRNAEDDGYYPTTMYIDEYENPDSPVLYLAFKRGDYYTINGTLATREPVYCIERYDLSKGRREAVLDNVENTILQMCSYGDYLYYVLSLGEKEQMLYRLYKAGGKPEKLDRESNVRSISVLDVIDDRLYYTVDSQFIYRCNLDLTGSEKVLDLSEVKGEKGTNGILAGSFSGYLYYFADVETVYAKPDNKGASFEKCSLYRIPTNNLTATPERVVEDMLYSYMCYQFTEGILYYEPCAFKHSDEESENWMEESYTPVNYSDGKLCAMDLKTGESKLILDDCGLTIFLKYALDDIVLFTGRAYNKTGASYSGNSQNLLMIHASGGEIGILGQNAPLGYVER